MLGEYQSSRTMRTREVGFPCSSVGKESACSEGNMGSIPGLGSSWRRKWQPTLVSLPGKSHGAWWAAVHGVAKSRTRLSDSHTLRAMHKCCENSEEIIFL